MPVPSLGYHTMDLSASLVQYWVDNPTTNLGLLFKSTGPASDNHTEFNTFDGPAATKPYLEVTFEAPCAEGTNTDADGDGYFANYSASDPQYDADDTNACIPNPAVGNCTGVDADGDGYFANYSSTHAQFDTDDANACVPDVNGSPTSSVTVNQGIDSYIKGKAINRGENHGKIGVIQHKARADDHINGLLQFDLTPHSGNNVVSATLYMYLESGNGSGNTIEAHRITTAWEEGTEVGWAGTSNWEEATDTNAWTTPGGDHHTSIEGSMTTESVGYKTMTLSAALVQDWIDNPSANFGLLLKSIGGDANKLIQFTSFDGATGQQPYLELILSACGGAGGNIDADGDGYFGNLPTNDPLYDSDDSNPNIPVSTNSSTDTVTTGQDNYIKEKSTNRADNYGGKPDLHVVNKANEKEHGLMQFDLSAYAGQTITSATLYMHAEKSDGAGTVVEAYKVLSAWDAGTGISGTGISNWEEATNTTVWTTPGGDYGSTLEGSMAVPVIGYHTMTLSASLIQDWVDNPITNFGLLFKSTGPESDKHTEFNTFDGPTNTRPYLVLNFDNTSGGSSCEDIDGDGNITICHSGTTTQTIPIGEWATHEAHGDICGPCADYKTIASGFWNSASTWEGGTIPPTTIDGSSVVINHTLSVQTDITVRGGGYLWLEGGGSFALQNGQLKIEDGTVIVKDVALDIQYGLELMNTNSDFQMINGGLTVGQLFKNTNGSVYLENVCLETGADYQVLGGTEVWKNVCAEIGTGGAGYYHLNNANVTMDAAKVKVLYNSFQNQSNSALIGTISALYVPNGNLENTATWTATVADYCVSGSVSVSPTYLPATENCSTIDANFSPCDCSGN